MQKRTLEDLENRLILLEPSGATPAQMRAFETERARIRSQITQGRIEQAESWSSQDWLAMIENSLDLLGEKVCGWMDPKFRH